MTFSCGIDFGTTNTAAALSTSKTEPTLIHLEGDSVIIPSALFIGIDKKIYFGKQAMQLYMNGENGRCMRSLKRVLGTDLMMSGTYFNNNKISFSELLSCFLKNIKNKIDLAAEANVDSVVLGRPVHFQDNNPNSDMRAENELRQIAQKAGFKNIEFQYEPIAAAFAHESKITEESLACVIDIGGGTSDFSIIKIGQPLMLKVDRTDDILSSVGIRIGGNDFDKDLSLKAFMPVFGYQTLQGGQTPYDKVMTLPTIPFRTMAEWSSINSMYTYKELNFAKKMLFNAQEKEKLQRFVELIEKQKGYSLLNTVEKTKIKLTEQCKINVPLNFISDKPVVPVSRQNLNESIELDVARIFKKVDECFSQAGIKPDDIQYVILTGGSTEIPLIQNIVSRYFPNAVLSQDNKFSSVSIGLTYDGMRRFSKRESSKGCMVGSHTGYLGR